MVPTQFAAATIQTIRLFLASPSDVGDERRVVRRIVVELNLPLEAHGWRVDLLGWEDRGPAGGRAQADINVDVERCDLFLGLLWRFWGTPTGDSSSGFAEEWGLALQRFERSGHPSLWLYFKDPGDDAIEDAQLTKVRAFRSEVEAAESAFYKPFADLAEFERLVRQKVLDAVFERTELTRAEIGVLTVDWPDAYRSDPVSLVADGSDRLEVAEGLIATAPRHAADIFSDLADELQELGFRRRVSNLRLKAGQALIAADDPGGAVEMLRRVLRHDVWWLQVEDAEIVLRDLDPSWPPELASELRVWRTCCGTLRDPAGAASRLEQALGQHHAFPVDPETEAIWRGVLWRCWLHLRMPERVIADPGPLPSMITDAAIEVTLLHADALRATGSATADEVWRSLRLQGLQRAQSDPATTAWIATRCAHDLAAAELMSDAEAAYVDAASRWTRAGAK